MANEYVEEIDGKRYLVNPDTKKMRLLPSIPAPPKIIPDQLPYSPGGNWDNNSVIKGETPYAMADRNLGFINPLAQTRNAAMMSGEAIGTGIGTAAIPVLPSWTKFLGPPVGRFAGGMAGNVIGQGLQAAAPDFLGKPPENPLWTALKEEGISSGVGAAAPYLAPMINRFQSGLTKIFSNQSAPEATATLQGMSKEGTDFLPSQTTNNRWLRAIEDMVAPKKVKEIERKQQEAVQQEISEDIATRTGNRMGTANPPRVIARTSGMTQEEMDNLLFKGNAQPLRENLGISKPVKPKGEFVGGKGGSSTKTENTVDSVTTNPDGSQTTVTTHTADASEVTNIMNDGRVEKVINNKNGNVERISTNAKGETTHTITTKGGKTEKVINPKGEFKREPGRREDLQGRFLQEMSTQSSSLRNKEVGEVLDGQKMREFLDKHKDVYHTLFDGEERAALDSRAFGTSLLKRPEAGKLSAPALTLNAARGIISLGSGAIFGNNPIMKTATTLSVLKGGEALLRKTLINPRMARVLGKLEATDADNVAVAGAAKRLFQGLRGTQFLAKNAHGDPVASIEIQEDGTPKILERYTMGPNGSILPDPRR